MNTLITADQLKLSSWDQVKQNEMNNITIVLSQRGDWLMPQLYNDTETCNIGFTYIFAPLFNQSRCETRFTVRPVIVSSQF